MAPVKQGLLEAGHKVVDESGPQAYESVREYEQVDPVLYQSIVMTPCFPSRIHWIPAFAGMTIHNL